MPLTAAKFSGYFESLVQHEDVVAAFVRVLARQVNVLKQMEFPLLAYWLTDAEPNTGGGSDGEEGQEVEFGVTVATRLEDGQSQAEELGRFIKVVKDTADMMAMEDPVDFEIGRWSTDSNAENADGSIVWASATVLMRFSRPRGDY